MKNKIVYVPGLKDPIKPSPGFAKKGLSDFKLDLMALCGFGCPYCSSNEGNYLRIRRKEFLDLTEKQLGERVLPSEDPSLTFVWRDILTDLKSQLDRKGDGWGAGHTLVLSMLTDAFSPVALKEGTTEAALRMVLERTRFRIRVLTKNAAAGSPEWIRFFKSYPGRFIVGLSIGSLDDEWARRIEVGTSLPSARLRALARLQDAGVPTFGMACPIFPDVLEAGALDKLIDRMRPDLVEDFWAEPFNNRTNWQVVRKGYAPGSAGYDWFTDVFEHRNVDRWSEYATNLYVRLLTRARDGGWTHKLRYLLYEERIVERDAPRFAGLEGVMLQSKPAADGRSANPFIARLQQATSAASPHPSAADLHERPRRHLPLLLEHPAEESRDEPAVQARCHADGNGHAAALRALGNRGDLLAGDSFDGLASIDGASASGATREKAATAMASSRRRTTVRKPREPQMKGKRENAAKSLPRVSRRSTGEEVRKIRLDEVIVPKRRARRLRDVTPLVESIAQTELIEPIVVRRLPDGRLVLVSGAHRLDAHRKLGRETILARIIVVSDLEAELIELDENLARIELTVLERGEHLLRRKEIYEQLHPEVKQGGAPGKKGGGKRTKDATVASFAENTSVMTGLSIRTIQDDVQIARLGDDTKKAIRGTPLEDQKRVLLQITRIAPDKQAVVADALASGRCRTVGEAAIKLGATSPRPFRLRRGDIKARVRDVARPLREARKRWDLLAADVDPASAPEALAIGEKLEAIEQKIAVFARSASTSTQPRSPHQARARDTSREGNGPVVSVSPPAVELAFAQGTVPTELLVRAPNDKVSELHQRITDAKSRFRKRHGGILDGTLSYAEYMLPFEGDPERARVVRERLRHDLDAFVRESSAFSVEVPERMRRPPAPSGRDPGGETAAPAGSSRERLPPAPQPTRQEARPVPAPPPVATSTVPPSKATQQTPTREEVEAVVAQILDKYEAGQLHRPLHGQYEIAQQHWPAPVRDEAIQLLISKLDALQRSTYAAQRSGLSSAVQVAALKAGARPLANPQTVDEHVAIRAAPAATAPSAARAAWAPSRESPAPITATAARGIGPFPAPVGSLPLAGPVGDLAKAAALARAGPVGDLAKAAALARAAPLVCGSRRGLPG